MDETAEQHEPQISTPVAILIGIIVIVADILDAFSFGIPVADIIAFPVTQIYLIMKGIAGMWMLVMNGLEIIPGADYLPLRTFGWFAVLWLDRHPKEKAAVEKVAAVVPGKKALAKSAAGATEQAAAKGAPVGARVAAKEAGALEETTQEVISGEAAEKVPAKKTEGVSAVERKEIPGGELPPEKPEAPQQSLYEMAEEVGAMPEPTAKEEPKKLFEETPANENEEDEEKLAA